jgi:hypothetical protein
MSKQEISSKVGRDQYNLVGDKAKLKVDNRTNSGASRKLIFEVAIGVAIAIISGYLLFQLGWS